MTFVQHCYLFIEGERLQMQCEEWYTRTPMFTWDVVQSFAPCPYDTSNSGAFPDTSSPIMSPKSPSTELNISMTKTLTNLWSISILHWVQCTQNLLTDSDLQRQLKLRCFRLCRLIHRRSDYTFPRSAQTRTMHSQYILCQVLSQCSLFHFNRKVQEIIKTFQAAGWGLELKM